MKNNIGLRIKELRNHLKLTQIDFCNKTGIKQANLSHIENKSEKIPIELIIKIICNFNIDANWLLTGEGEKMKGPTVAPPIPAEGGEAAKIYKGILAEKEKEIGALQREIGALMNLKENQSQSRYNKAKDIEIEALKNENQFLRQKELAQTIINKQDDTAMIPIRLPQKNYKNKT